MPDEYEVGTLFLTATRFMQSKETANPDSITTPPPDGVYTGPLCMSMCVGLPGIAARQLPAGDADWPDDLSKAVPYERFPGGVGGRRRRRGR